MSKTAIGFFKEPLSQVEVDYIYDQLQQDWIDRLWLIIYETLHSGMMDIFKRYGNYDMDRTRLLSYLDDHFNNWVGINTSRKTISPTGVYGFNVKFTEEAPELCYIEYSPDIARMRDGGYSYPPAGRLENYSQRFLVDEINRHLTRYPQLRLVDKEYKKIDEANDELVKILSTRGYQSETGNDLPDFSDFLLKLAK